MNLLSVVILLAVSGATQAFTSAPTFRRPQNSLPPSITRASGRGLPAPTFQRHDHGSISLSRSGRQTCKVLLSGERLVGGRADGGGGSSGPPRSGGPGRGGGDDGSDRGGGGNWEDMEGVVGDMMALGAAQMMMASGEQPFQPESVLRELRGGYRRRSMYGRRPIERQRSSNMRGNGITATNFIIALNAIVYAFQTRYPAITKAGWKLAPAITQRGQWYRLFTPIVLHGSFTHLAVNSMSFSSVGPVVENVMGTNRFVTVYVLAGMAGNILSCMVNPRTPAVGASGAIFGMVGAWGAFCLMNEAVLGRNNSQRALKNVAQTVMINVVYGMSSSQIDNMGHLGGFLGGAAMTFIIGPRLRRRQNPLTGQPYIVDESLKLTLPRLGRKA